MDVMYNPDELNRVTQARASYSGRLLTDRQFDDAMALTGVLERRIKETGAFRDCLNDFANAYARNERFDYARADSTVRDLFKIRTGVTPKQMLDSLIENEQKLFDPETGPDEAHKQRAYQSANEVGRMVEDGTLMSAERAFAYQAAQLATELNITDRGAKIFISDVFEETEGREFREWRKELDDKYFRPQIEAEKRQRQQQKTYSRSPQPVAG